MATITIDNKEYTVEEGRNLIDAAAEVGVEIPHFCYHPGLRPDGNCRMCLTEMEIRPGQFGLATACTVRIKDGMKFRTQTPQALDNRKGIMEFLLINHPLDCPWCDQAGECQLQDYSFDHGRAHSRFVETKRVPPKKELGPHIVLFSTRCILCQRCTRFCDDISGTSELGIVQMGSRSEIATFPGKPLDNKMSANVADICPVGALVTRDFLYKPRIWHYTKTDTICPGCSSGCNTTLEVMHQKIYRTRPRTNLEVNEYWMCDEGRFSYHAWQEMDRLKTPMIRVDGALQTATWPQTLKTIVDGFTALMTETGPSPIAVIGSAMATNEENFLLRRLAERGFKTSHIGLYRKPSGEEWVSRSGFRIEADKTPNRRGAGDMLGVDNMDAALEGIRNGQIKGVLFLNGDPGLRLSADEKEALSRLAFLTVIDVGHSELMANAHVALPGATPFEKDGVMTNVRGRAQRLQAAYPPPAGARLDSAILGYIGKSLGVEGTADPSDITDEIARTIPGYAGISYASIGDQGVLTGGAEPSEAAGG